MELDLSAVPEPLRLALAGHLESLGAQGGPPSSGKVAEDVVRSLPMVWACSDFVADACRRDPRLLPWLADAGRLHEASTREWLEAGLAAEIGADPVEASFMDGLRRFRRRQLARIAWRDLAQFEDVEPVLRELSLLADVCIGAARDYAIRDLRARFGTPRGQDGSELELMVLGMGKLGGGELNFSSDIDLVFLFPEHGETDGKRPLEHEEFFTRLGRRIAQLLGTVTSEGFVYRVDLRLRPFGESGPLVVSFDAFEDYLQQHGRDWERYAYVKARPVIGAARFDELYRNVLRPFVYRRYLDFRVFESLREMKTLISREVERRELKGNVKLGPGGIREIEFIVQAYQLIRGGANPRLQTRSLLEALPLLARKKLLPDATVEELAESYRFLRRVENRLQERNDEQTHELPRDEVGRARLAFAMGVSDWAALEPMIVDHCERVSVHFQRVLFAPDQPGAVDANARALEMLLEHVGDGARLQALQAAGMSDAEAVLERIELLRESTYYRRLDEAGRQRLQTLLPRLLQAIAGGGSEAVALSRLLHVLERIGGRTVYLALLNENATARDRFVELCAHSQFLTDQIAAFPLLLDELLDERLFESEPSRADFAIDLRERMAGADAGDPERQVDLLRQFQRAAMFRVAVPDLTGRLPVMKVSDRLTDIAEFIVMEALELSWGQIVARHGVPQCGDVEPDPNVPGPGLHDAGMIVVAYGKFGGIELGYGSDLDLVFLHDSAGGIQHTQGPAVIENGVFFLRLVQRMVHLLTLHSAAGRLYEVDTRLRPSGKGGLLVQSLDGFRDYQRGEAWTWEHQALLRARAVAGPPALRARFEAVRLELLRTGVRRDSLREEVRKMRERMRAELSNPEPGQFDLKRDAGGITDIEFLGQYWTLLWCDRHPELATYSDNIRQLESLASIDLVPQATVDVLTGIYRAYRQRIHRLSLDGEATVVPETEFAEERAQVTAIWTATIE
ncbi:MAG: bifunctional [glutamate--ammonia ligase]-adenylyl-L-tyrosine phosphorylase/[glutamate--ammonia-ligase] adenylyltransferase [Steroidobacteraceae bacterium]|nr:bifunctional [glutamate--ammonia ligase]-adenylyl-L-tyrosine phosphorylase/[glutamate--ammonia-ligase] adenylyltransferase [Steroidobacteraceae bacterium]